MLLGFLDDGEITDNKGNVLDFTNSIFLFTSNVGIHDNVGIKTLGFENEVSTYESTKQDLPIKITKKLVSHVVDNAYSPEYGARNIKRYIKQNVTLKLADKILNGSEAKQFKPKFQEGELHVEEI